MSGEVRVGIIGSGRIARTHADAYRSVARGSLVGCTDVNPEAAAKFASENDIAVFDRAEAMLESPDIDAVIIATPNGLHAEQTIAALRAGKHVFCQKPIAMTLEEADSVVAEAARHSGRVLQYGFMLRFTPPMAELRRRLQSGAFADWRLSVEGRVASPRTFSLADLKALPSRTQITRHTCEEGWTAIGQWTGVPLSAVLDVAGVLPTARFVMFRSYDDWIDSIDLLDAFHPQTILAYGMNGGDLPIPHGAPLRLRVERQMGYKSMKYLQRIIVVQPNDVMVTTMPTESGSPRCQ